MIDNRRVATPPEIAGAVPGRRGSRVVLADDDVLLREGLASLLERSGFEVAGQAGNGPELLALVRSVRPELAVIQGPLPTQRELLLAAMQRHRIPGTIIGCRYGACWLTTTTPSWRRRVFCCSEKA